MSSVGRSVDPAICEVLQKIGVIEFAQYFEGISEEKFQKYSLEDLWNLLPGKPGQLAAAKIRKFYLNEKETLLKSQLPTTATSSSINGETNSSVESQLAESTSVQVGQSQENNSIEDESEDEERTIFSSQPVSKQVVEIDLSDDDDREVVSTAENEGASNRNEEIEESQPSSSRYSLRQRSSNGCRKYKTQEEDTDEDNSSSDDEPLAKRVKSSSPDSPTFFQLKNPRTILNRIRRDPDSLDTFSHIQVVIPVEDYDQHLCDTDDPKNEKESKLWQQFYTKVGPHIYSLKLSVWTWKHLKSKCPYNLLKILTQHCPNLSELSLGVNPSQIDSAKWPTATSLPKLTALKISHAGKLEYTSQLKEILRAAINIQNIDYSFWNLDDVNFLLDNLGSLDKVNLKDLKSLSLRSYDKDGFLKQYQFLKLAQIDADLETLELGNGLWEDIKAPTIEATLQRFSNLKKLVIYGSFLGNSYRTPNITVNVPPLPLLEYLDIGGNYEFGSVFETPNQHPPSVITVDDEDKTDLFSVTLQLPLLPSCKVLILGNLFKIDELHFSSLPKLTTFRVGSPWHLSVKFPMETSRKFSYPNLTEIQLPDCLKDSSFVKKIPMRFPNIKKCYIFLPSVAVLRSFFYAMADSSLEELYLKTQYDFESTMETCLLGRPTDALRSYSDFMKLEDLKAYKYFEQFVSFHNIELPIEKLTELEQEENFAGLAALKSLKILQLEHIGRTLRIPTGNFHWSNTNCRFSGNVIGFRQYPLSKKCLEQLPLQNLKRCTWPNFLVSCNDISKLIKHGFSDYKSDDDAELCTTSESSTSRNSDKGKEKLKVQIQPAMLQADFKFHQKKEKT